MERIELLFKVAVLLDLFDHAILELQLLFLADAIEDELVEVLPNIKDFVGGREEVPGEDVELGFRGFYRSSED